MIFNRKKYSLVLGGGGARGYMHIGVYKYLQTKNIEIGEVIGTSMGAIIAAFIATGKSVDEIRDIVAKNEAKKMKLIDIDVPTGTIKGGKILKMFEEIFGDILIEETEIPLKIIATELETGKKKVFTKGKIIDAIRASISIPIVFKPHCIENKYYIDGGCSSNLAVEEAVFRNIIAVSVNNSPKFDYKNQSGIKYQANFFNYVLDLLIDKNEELSVLKAKNKNIIYVSPKSDECGITFLTFEKYDEAIELGFKYAKKANII